MIEGLDLDDFRLLMANSPRAQNPSENSAVQIEGRAPILPLYLPTFDELPNEYCSLMESDPITRNFTDWKLGLPVGPIEVFDKKNSHGTQTFLQDTRHSLKASHSRQNSSECNFTFEHTGDDIEDNEAYNNRCKTQSGFNFSMEAITKEPPLVGKKRFLSEINFEPETIAASKEALCDFPKEADTKSISSITDSSYIPANVSGASSSEYLSTVNFTKVVLYVSGTLEMCCPKEVSKHLQVVAFAATGKRDVLFDCAKDGFEALHLMSKKCYHAIFINYDLPNMNGIETIRIAHEVSSGNIGPIILIGGNSELMNEVDRKMLLRHFPDSDSDPFRGIDFVDSLRDILDASRR
jgi:CheY-like chemotaxis protein